VKIVPVTDEIRAMPSFAGLRAAWPTFLLHDPLSNEYWGRLYSERREFQFALVEEDEVLAEGNAIPVAGMPAGWRDAFPNGFGDGEPDRLCALAILVGLDHHGKGLSQVMLGHMRELAAGQGWELVAPVRPTWKTRYPLTPIERYASWRRDDGLLFDPWLRVHERLGAEVIGVGIEAMRIPGSVAEWEEWAGMAFPESGDYVVPGALAPVQIDRERDEGLYVEPNVWMRHAVLA
jgi:GNAT superfamily N-acetyltransferase